MIENRRPLASAVILAGGDSTRLGRDKALLLLDGQILLARVVEALSSLSDDLIVVSSDLTRYASLALPARFVADERPGYGALMGLYTGLKAARYPHALAVACDMPFLNLPLLRFMLSLTNKHDVVVPRFDGYLEPLHALYGKACLPAMERVLAQGRRQIVAFFDDVRVRYVEKHEIDRFDLAHLSFVNVNTPEDWARVQALMPKREGAR
jgi:molybdopterin-guanine dinucleotide biosynthesis protein A